jgi:hypothetical protein
MTGPIFYNDKVKAARYINNILHLFFCQANRKRKVIKCFPTIPKNSATAHMAHICLEALHEVFSDCVTSFGLWPPYSPD